MRGEFADFSLCFCFLVSYTPVFMLSNPQKKRNVWTEQHENARPRPTSSAYPAGFECFQFWVCWRGCAAWLSEGNCDLNTPIYSGWTMERLRPPARGMAAVTPLRPSQPDPVAEEKRTARPERSPALAASPRGLAQNKSTEQKAPHKAGLFTIMHKTFLERSVYIFVAKQILHT